MQYFVRAEEIFKKMFENNPRASCFYGWSVLRGMHTRFQHTALYASGILSTILAFFAFIPELSFYSSLAIAYSSLVFGALFVMDSSK